MTDPTPDLEPLNVDCGRCGWGLDAKPDAKGRVLVYEDEEIVCATCGATNQMGVDDSYEDSDADDYGEPIGVAYVSHWTCRHGVSEDDSCGACDVDDALAEVAMERERNA
jgi:hypothetical protein